MAVLVGLLVGGAAVAEAGPPEIVKQPLPDKVAVLTFDDAVRSQITVVAPVLKACMKYLKDNHYTMIALRDLARYVDVKKALDMLGPAWEKETR